jgi:hypothetical protein
MMNGVAVQNGSFRRSFDRGAKNVSVRSDGLAGAIELTGTRKWLIQNAEVCGEEEPADYFYKVVSGVVRTHKLVIDGRRLVGAFIYPETFSASRRMTGACFQPMQSLMLKSSSSVLTQSCHWRSGTMMWLASMGTDGRRASARAKPHALAQ